MGTVSFDGQAPYALPVTQQAKAYAVGDMVELHIRVLVDAKHLESVTTMMTPNQAILLSQQLAAQGAEALANKRHS